MTDAEIRAAVSVALDKTKVDMVTAGRVYPVRPALTPCKWCGRLTRRAFCSHRCIVEFTCEDGRHE